MGAAGPLELRSQKAVHSTFGGVRVVNVVGAGALQTDKKGGGEGGLGRWLSGPGCGSRGCCLRAQHRGPDAPDTLLSLLSTPRSTAQGVL